MSACAMCSYDPDARVMSSWTFMIDREVVSMNAHRVNIGGFAGRAYRKDRDNWYLEFVNARNLLKIPHAERRRRVVLTRLYDGRSRMWDQDNLVGGGKSTVDAMILAQLLVADSHDFAEVHWKQTRGARGLHVLLEELED
jgi:hypothetical protein